MISVAHIAQGWTERHNPGVQISPAVQLGNDHSYPAVVGIWKNTELTFSYERGVSLEFQIAMYALRVQVGIAAKIGPVSSPERLVGLKVHVQRMVGIGEEKRRTVPIQNLDTSTKRRRAIHGLIAHFAGPCFAIPSSRNSGDAPIILLALCPPLPVETRRTHHERRYRDARLKPFSYIGRCHDAMLSRVGVLAEAMC
jgi:hypothetical protein